ncbi:uncharacterized protein LOC121743997 isoform X3 [Salvia splendens]|uniref:uncharacterized protein LOC121743997 isoform X3 n=1 Tax=Salvia splendens TaxID=180675 RepID=UPI001C27E9C5|nr:uncharacterized protein LOC121743997 isoform X3 [Salvia splendens]
MPPQNPPVRALPQNPPIRAPPQNQPRSTREDETFTTRVHHCGKMVNTIGKQYVGGGLSTSINVIQTSGQSWKLMMLWRRWFFHNKADALWYAVRFWWKMLYWWAVVN